jgi:hypothetical protein
MVQIRVGVSGLNGSGPAIDLGELVAARHVRWVEIDGVRVEGSTLTSVSGRWDGESFHTTTVEFLGLPEFVYLGKDGEPLE